MNTLKDIISDIRVFLYGGVRTLPLTIAGTMLLIGTFTANYAMLFFLIGYLILTPMLAYLFNIWVGELLFDKALGIPLLRVNVGDLCGLTVPYQTTKDMSGTKMRTVLCSEWLAMITFFFTYLFFNAYDLYTYTPPESSPDQTLDVTSTEAPDIVASKTTNRKSQAGIALGSIVLIAVCVIGYRIFYSGCETSSETSTVICRLIMISIFGYGAYWYYVLLGTVGQNRLADLFGINNRLLAPGAIVNGPIACVPMPV